MIGENKGKNVVIDLLVLLGAEWNPERIQNEWVNKNYAERFVLTPCVPPADSGEPSLSIQ